MELVLGVDAGGTSSRAALFTLDGRLVRRGRAGGANPGALGPEPAAANLTAAVREALAGGTRPRVVAVVAGLAGHPGRCATLAERVFRAALGEDAPGAHGSGSAGAVPVRSVGDVVTAFASGTAAPSGTVLISGTGAVAARIVDHRPVATADGFGWLLGDEGSAFWLGRAAARATLRALAARPATGSEAAAQHTTGPAAEPAAAAGPDAPSRLAELVVRQLVPGRLDGDPVAQLAAAVHARPPLALAGLAPLVSRAAAEGDPVAVAIVEEAASRLARTASHVRLPGLPIVLAGGVLTAAGPVRDAVRSLLRDAVTAGDAAGAAAWLAARPFMNPRESEARHPHFTRRAG